MSKTITRFLFTPDIHIGKEKAHVKGNLVIRPTHSIEAIKVMFNFAHDYKPHVWILGGDQINFGPISHWNKSKPRITEGFRLKDEYQAFEDLILAPIEAIMAKSGLRNPLKIWHRGNHEQWLDDELDINPSLEGLIEVESYLKLAARKWDIKDYGEVSKLGKIYFVHGDTALRRGTMVSPAKYLVTQYHRNIRAGHLHTWDAHTLKSAVDAQDYHTGVVVPSLSTRAFDYAKNAPSNCINGFLHGLVWDGGFSDTVQIINKGHTAYGNTIY